MEELEKGGGARKRWRRAPRSSPLAKKRSPTWYMAGRGVVGTAQGKKLRGAHRVMPSGEVVLDIAWSFF